MENLIREGKAWPMLLDLTENECRNALRELELNAYSSVVSVLRAQGELTKEKRKMLNDLQSLFCISTERHKAEIRRAVNDELLNTLAETLAGPNSGIEWSIEGRRLISLMPRLPPQVAYTALATHMAQKYCGINTTKPKPCDTAHFGKMQDFGAGSDFTDSEDETEGLRFITNDMVPEKFIESHSSYTTLPLSKARLAKEKIKESLVPPEPVSPSSVSSADSSPSSIPPSVRIPPAPTPIGPEKRKRKRSFSMDLVINQSSVVSSLNVSKTGTDATESLPATSRQPSLGNSMKLGTPLSRSTSVSSHQTVQSLSHAQKVILVSTSGANSGSSSSLFPRSISVPILKNPQNSQLGMVKGHSLAGSQASPSIHTVSASHVSAGSQHSSLGGVTTVSSSAPTTSVSSSTGLPPLSFVRSVRPRVPPSVSSCLQSAPGVPKAMQRQRSNSLVLQSERGDSLPDTPSGGSNSSQLQIRTPVPCQEPSIQVRQQDGNLSSNPASPSISQGASRILNRSSRILSRSSTLPAQVPQVSQGVYIVSTNSGTITFVTRTICSVPVSTPRVVTMNPASTSRPSIIRPGNIVSLGMQQKKSIIPPKKSIQTVRVTPQPTISTRTIQGTSLSGAKVLTSNMGGTKVMTPNLSATSRIGGSVSGIGGSTKITSKISGITGVGAKSNVIVVHKGTIPSGARSVGIQGFKDLSKVKPMTPGMSQQITHISAQGSTPKNINASVCTPSGQHTISTVMKSTTNKASIFGRVSTTGSHAIVTLTQVPASQNAAALVSSSNIGCSVISVNASTSNTVSTSYGTSKESGSKPCIVSTNVVMSQKDSGEQQVGSSMFNVGSITASSSLPSKMRGSSPSRLSPTLISSSHTLKVSKLSKSDTVLTPNTSDKDLSDDGLDDAHNFSLSSSVFLDDKEDAESTNEWLKFGLDETTTTDDDSEVDKKSKSKDVASPMEREIVIGEKKMMFLGRDKEIKIGKVLGGGEDGRKAKGGVHKESVLDKECKVLVEKAVDVLNSGDKDQARTLLTKAGFELMQTRTLGGDSFSISKMGDVPSSSTSMASILLSSKTSPKEPEETRCDTSGTEGDSSPLNSIVGDLDPATGLFYSPSGDNSSDSTSLMSPGSPSRKMDDTSILVSERMSDMSDLNESSDDR